MRKTLLLLCFGLFVSSVYCQQDSIQPTYLKFPVFPPVKLLLPDSSTFYSKNDLPKKSSVILMLFNPQCSHCQYETEQMIEHITAFNSVQIIMATSMPFDSMMSFREKYKLARFKNIVVAQDTYFFLPVFYMIHNMPFHAFYNRKKELISVFEGSMTIEKILKEINK
jgi:hypothetical protein